MSSEIKKIKLKDILEITSSKRIFMSEYVDIGIPFYRSKEIIEKAKGGNISTELFITEDKFNDIEKKFGVPVNGDILLTSVGTIGIPYLIQQNDKFYFKDGNLTWFKNFSNKLYNKFMLYWLQSKDAQNKFDMITIGSTQKALTISSLKELEIPLPSLLTQKKIAHILSTLDDKIELNRKMNQTLEEMAQTIFKSWFVDFDPVHAKANCEDEAELENIAKELGISKEILDLFPSEFEERELAMIPKGWNLCSIYEIIDVIYGAPFSSSNFNDQQKGKPLIRIRDLKTFNSQHWTEEIHPKGTLITAGDLLIGMDAEFTPTIWQGINGWLNQRVCKIKSKNGSYTAFNYFILKPKMEFFEKSNVGTTVIHLGKKDIDTIELLIPPEELLNASKKIIEPLFDKLVQNSLEIRELQKTRDTLLPKLLSGEIDVSDLELKV